MGIQKKQAIKAIERLHGVLKQLNADNLSLYAELLACVRNAPYNKGRDPLDMHFFVSMLGVDDSEILAWAKEEGGIDPKEVEQSIRTLLTAKKLIDSDTSLSRDKHYQKLNELYEKFYTENKTWIDAYKEHATTLDSPDWPFAHLRAGVANTQMPDGTGQYFHELMSEVISHHSQESGIAFQRFMRDMTSWVLFKIDDILAENLKADERDKAFGALCDELAAFVKDDKLPKIQGKEGETQNPFTAELLNNYYTVEDLFIMYNGDRGFFDNISAETLSKMFKKPDGKSPSPKEIKEGKYEDVSGWCVDKKLAGILTPEQRKSLIVKVEEYPVVSAPPTGRSSPDLTKEQVDSIRKAAKAVVGGQGRGTSAEPDSKIGVGLPSAARSSTSVRGSGGRVAGS